MQRIKNLLLWALTHELCTTACMKGDIFIMPRESEGAAKRKSFYSREEIIRLSKFLITCWILKTLKKLQLLIMINFL
jgi:hypothetical protein